MTNQYELRLTVPQTVPAGRSKEIFYWSTAHLGTVVATMNHKPVGPKLGQIGPVPRPNIDFVRLATAVFAADRSTPRARGGSNWSRRDFELTVPVFDPDAWNAIEPRLSPLLQFLTGDRWALRFVPGRSAAETVKKPLTDIERVVLVSGGADSACGALFSRAELGDANQVFVSHLGATNLAPSQNGVVEAVGTLLPGGEIHHRQINIGRRRQQIDGASYGNETSSRSRSLLFLSLGLAEAAIHGVELWVPENGFASLNPPLGPERRGSLSTRTTQPAFLAELPKVLADAGVHSDLRNPCERMTKGEMFTKAAQLVGDDEAAGLLSGTHSCAHTGHRPVGVPMRTQCGVCFGCTVRRAAFAASDLDDTTEYLSATTPTISAYIERNSAARAMRDFITRGITGRDIAAMSLPSGYPPAEALDLCQRMIGELEILSP
jgi:hypothetical protein